MGRYLGPTRNGVTDLGVTLKLRICNEAELYKGRGPGVHITTPLVTPSLNSLEHIVGYCIPGTYWLDLVCIYMYISLGAEHDFVFQFS